MKRILLCLDGTQLNKHVQYIQQSTEKAYALDILYVIEQNLVHYGQVDQLATPDSKQEFIEYVQEIGIKECQEKLGDFVCEIENNAKQNNQKLEVTLHVRWGNTLEAIEEILRNHNNDSLIIPENTWNINWQGHKKLLALAKKFKFALQII